jgi:hypothetical protein
MFRFHLNAIILLMSLSIAVAQPGPRPSAGGGSPIGVANLTNSPNHLTNWAKLSTNVLDNIANITTINLSSNFWQTNILHVNEFHGKTTIISNLFITTNGSLNLSNVAAHKLLRTDAAQKVAEVTVGSGLSFDGTTLSSTASALADFLIGTNAASGGFSNNVSPLHIYTAIATGTSTANLILSNTTVATAGNQALSPFLEFGGNGWKTQSTAGSQPVKVRIGAVPVQATVSPTVLYRIQTSTNGSTYRTVAEWDADTGQTNQNQYLALGQNGTAPMVLSAPMGTSMGFLSSGANQLRLNGNSSVTIATSHTDRFSMTSSEFQPLTETIDNGQPGARWRSFWIINQVRKSGDTTSTSDTLATCAFPSMTLVATRNWKFSICMFFTNTVAADGLKFNYSGGDVVPTAMRCHTLVYDDTGLIMNTNTTALATQIICPTITGATTVYSEMTIEVSSGSTFIPQFAHESRTTGTLTCQRNSSIVPANLP